VPCGAVRVSAKQRRAGVELASSCRKKIKNCDKKRFRSADADAFDEELKLVRRRAAAELVRNQADEDKGADDATTSAKRLIKQSGKTLSGER